MPPDLVKFADYYHFSPAYFNCWRLFEGKMAFRLTKPRFLANRRDNSRR